MKLIVMGFFHGALLMLIFIAVASANSVEITGTWKKAKVSKGKRLINVHPSVFKSCNNWCEGRCKYVQIDPNQNHLFRYVCKKEIKK